MGTVETLLGSCCVFTEWKWSTWEDVVCLTKLSLMEVSPVEDVDCVVLTGRVPVTEELLDASKNVEAEETGAGEMMGENPFTDWEPSESW